MNAYPWIPPWLGPLCSLIVAALVTIHLLGGHWWLYAVLAVGAVGGFMLALGGWWVVVDLAEGIFYGVRARFSRGDKPAEVDAG